MHHRRHLLRVEEIECPSSVHPIAACQKNTLRTHPLQLLSFLCLQCPTFLQQLMGFSHQRCSPRMLMHQFRMAKRDFGCFKVCALAFGNAFNRMETELARCPPCHCTQLRAPPSALLQSPLPLDGKSGTYKAQ